MPLAITDGKELVTINAMTLLFFTFQMASFITFAHSIDTQIKVGGYIDTQYAIDFNSPKDRDRLYTTQPARNNEFNLNLGFIELTWNKDTTRARLALQAGTSVQANYASEPNVGTISGDQVSRHIQEARVGYKATERTWIDAGIFFAHVGAESWISQNNLTLTRSLVADFSPYYLSGVKVTHQATSKLQLQLIVANGWQNISENNSDKAIGTGIEYQFINSKLIYNTLMGKEVSPPLVGSLRASAFRHFHNLIYKSQFTEILEGIIQFDIGIQKRNGRPGESVWFGSTSMLRWSLNASHKLNLRFESYRDNDQIIIVTPTNNSVNFWGSSLGYDQILDHDLYWRTEIRYLRANRLLFTKNETDWSDQNLTLISSLSFNF